MSQELPIERIMQAALLTCDPATPLSEAATRMAERRCSSILVMQAGKPVGIWTERDALAVDFSDLAAMQCPIAKVMSSPVSSLHRSTPVGEAMLALDADNRRHLLVVGDAGEPLGMVTQTDLAVNQGIEPYLRLREISSVLSHRPLVLPGHLLLAEAAAAMRQHGDAAVVEANDAGELGIITERDVVRFIARYPGNTPVGPLASRPLITVREQDTLIYARDRLIDLRLRHLAVVDTGGQVVGLLGFRDMLAGAERLYVEDLRRALEQRDKALALSRQNLQMAERVIDASLEGIIITDRNGVIEYVNPAFCQVTGYGEEEAVGRTPALLSSGRHDAVFYRRMWHELDIHRYWRGEIWNRRKGGALYLERLTITAITDEDDKVTHYAALFSDITLARENEERVRRLAYYDALTRLPNRRLLEDRLALAIRHAHRQQQRLAVIFIDLDHFKQVNDTLGHAVGDELLLQVAERLQAKLREDDTLARLGGDEFLVLLSELDGLEEVTRVARRLIDAISQPFDVLGNTFRMGCSLGISLYPEDGTTADTLVRSADTAMYRAKREGRNTYRLFRAEMNDHDSRLLALESALRDTVESGEGLAVHYQPLISRDSGEVEGAEALVRWKHPEFGSVSPATFIPMAERSGLIIPLGQWVMEQVAEQLCEWRKAGLAPPRVAVNLSASQFWQRGLVEQIRQLFARFALPPGQIGFELTESVLLDRQQEAVAVLEALRELGCRIAIDDFGTGYSSLSYLQDLPLTTLKVDRRFVQRLAGDESERRGSAAIIAAVTGLAQELGLRVVAEGVETQEQLDALARYPVTLIQGYLTGRPVDAETFATRYLHKG
ncbi:EAL domain-containing protein [Halomonas sp.]|uniref:EAL domain-containing protein n=1 Tax=Halomonas sp. TaxID=1486246 RepID=UPI00384BB6E9